MIVKILIEKFVRLKILLLYLLLKTNVFSTYEYHNCLKMMFVYEC